MKISKHYVHKSLLALIPFAILLIWSFIDVNSIQQIDNRITLMIYGLRTDWLTPFFMTITLLGNPPTVVTLTIVLAAVAYYAQRKKPALSLWIIIAMAIGNLGLNPLVKNLIARQRPDEDLRLISEMSYSFPSGHAFASMSLFGALIIIILLKMKASKWRTLLVAVISIVIVLVGLSRLYLGVHYFSDIIAGYSLGLSWLLLTYSLVRPRIE